MVEVDYHDGFDRDQCEMRPVWLCDRGECCGECVVARMRKCVIFDWDFFEIGG